MLVTLHHGRVAQFPSTICSSAPGFARAGVLQASLSGEPLSRSNYLQKDEAKCSAARPVASGSDQSCLMLTGHDLIWHGINLNLAWPAYDMAMTRPDLYMRSHRCFCGPLCWFGSEIQESLSPCSSLMPLPCLPLPCNISISRQLSCGAN